MKVGILAQLKQKKITGINRVTMGVMTELLQIDQESKYYFVGNTDWLPLKMDSIDILYSSDQAISLSYMEAAYKLDIIHSHYKPFELSLRLKCGKILTVHDLIPYLHPEWNNNQYDYFDGPIRKCAQEADRIIAVSDNTKRDIIEHYGVQPDKIQVIYNGLYPKGQFRKEAAGRKPTMAPDGDFLLSVTAVGANKNQAGLIQAFLNYKMHHKEDGIKLVITGPTRQYQVMRSVMEKYADVSDSVIFTGFVADDELIWLYKSAKAFIYVSFYEGFGLPILEALSMGKAVVCSNTSSMPEVGGDAVEYCDPYSIESIESSIERVLLNDDYRISLENRAEGQAAKFSYENTARQTLELYRAFI